MLGIGLQELLVIFVVALLVFGPQRLPEIGRSLGRALRELQRTQDDFRTTVERELHLGEGAAEPAAGPVGGGPTAAMVASGPGTDQDGSGPAARIVSAAVSSWSSLHEDAVSDGDREGPFVGGPGGRLVHRVACPFGPRPGAGEPVPFQDLRAAHEAGRLPCPVCLDVGAPVSAGRTPRGEVDAPESVERRRATVVCSVRRPGSEPG